MMSFPAKINQVLWEYKKHLYSDVQITSSKIPNAHYHNYPW